MMSAFLELIGFLTVIAAISLTIMTYMGWIIMCAGQDEEDEITMFGFAWGFDKEDEYL